MLVCSNSKCHNRFVKKAPNQIYCSSECCKVVTSEKLKEKYRLDKERKSGKKRICNNCTTLLSKSNPLTLCSICDSLYTVDKKRKLKEALCR